MLFTFIILYFIILCILYTRNTKYYPLPTIPSCPLRIQAKLPVIKDVKELKASYEILKPLNNLFCYLRQYIFFPLISFNCFL